MEGESQQLPAPDAALSTRVGLACANSRKRILFIEHQGEKLCIKRAQRNPGRRVTAWFTRLLLQPLCHHPVKLSAVIAPDRQEGLHHEATRLMQYNRAGVATPKLKAVSDYWFAMSVPGILFGNALREGDQAEREALLRDAVIALADFHEADHWHGGAQIKNLLYGDGQIYRIDFEERLATAFDLPLIQVWDVFGFMMSVGRLRKYFDIPTRERLIETLVREYLARGERKQLQDLLARFARRGLTLVERFRFTRYLGAKRSLERVEMVSQYILRGCD
ncbi:hypothetical protein VCB98_13025 [Gammaproteobacteria bacterium AB-CW1]|uniref:Mn2+-dependent serine/threonine protein kinase n=1 Tax=Natronospira elongata TaxID=3110268 RepID=A0AAP6ML21_9GAMM|nr:hypothetical protein [Gammaproteobacteria bacterium AB-CW1]